MVEEGQHLVRVQKGRVGGNERGWTVCALESSIHSLFVGEKG